MSAPNRLTDDEQVVLGKWAVEMFAAEMGYDEDAARMGLEVAHLQGRVQMVGDAHLAMVLLDGRTLVAESRGRLAEAAHEWQTLRHMKRQLED
jgi:folylpolyglutamate synthase/dihydropteroate synthase